MDLITLLFLAIGLSMDAFAVSVCKGLAMPKINPKNCVAIGLWFGSFQGLMPLTGYILGMRFASYIDTFSSWIAFILLSFIGSNMIWGALKNEGDGDLSNGGLGIKDMFLLSIATSIDALAVGITFACIPVHLTNHFSPFINTAIGCLIICAVTCLISIAGVKIGDVFGSRHKRKAEITGGAILILLGIKILLEHLF